MYFRMLKRDLKDKVTLNIVLCIFMMVAATLIVVSTGFVYTFLGGIERTYEKCNTSDIIFLSDKSISMDEEQKGIIINLLRSDSRVGDIDISERVYLSTSRLEFDGIDKRSVTNLYNQSFMMSPVSRGQNIPYDLNNELFTLESGCIALPEVMAHNAGTHIGDKVRLTTDMGNIYEFTVSHIFKDPSTSMINKILFADEDLEALKDEFTKTMYLYEVTLITPFSSVGDLQNWGWYIYEKLHEYSEEGIITGGVYEITTGKSNTFTDDAMMALIVSIFMCLMGIATIILIFMCISFTLHATVKREEKEIGTMKAIGVDSLSYKMLFIVKYIAFAIIGGCVGLLAGIPLCEVFVSKFVINTLNPDRGVIIILGLAGSFVFILLMIAFSLISLRRMKKISVMDAIHGENRGERFSRIPGVSLNSTKKISVPTFLAVQDIVRKMKRYIFLMISYAIGIAIVLLVFQVKRTVVSDDYRKTYWYQAERDVMIRPDDDLRNSLLNRVGSERNLYLYYEKYYNENGIPLDIQLMDVADAYIIDGDDRVVSILGYGDYDISRLVVKEGGHVPTLPNEAAVSHFLNELRGVELGDVITLEYKVYMDDGFSIETVRKDFVVSAFVENLGGARSPAFFTSINDENIVPTGFNIFNEEIVCDDSEYDAYIEKMRAVNEDILIWDYDQVLDYDLGNTFGRLLDFLAISIGIILTATLFSMSFLYQQIFIEEEASDIAMLKSMGFDKHSIRKWHFMRFIILIIISLVLALLIAMTFNKIVFEAIGCATLGVANFDIASPPLAATILLPAGLVLIVSLVMTASFSAMDQIRIWRIRNE